MSSKPHYLGPEYANRFKDSSLVEAYRTLLSKFGATSKVEMQVVGTVLWGVPESGKKTGENV
jgi:hypothetical protein